VYLVLVIELPWLIFTQIPHRVGSLSSDDYLSFDVLLRVPTNSSINHLEMALPSFNHHIKKLDGKVDIRKLEFKGYTPGKLHSEASLNKFMNFMEAN
jgi:hypothetical protein